MKTQKAFVVEAVKQVLGTAFVPFQDIALLKLSSAQLEQVKSMTVAAILNGQVEYGKDVSDVNEAKTYGRSMVMNHLKKAKELNGNMVFQTNGDKTVAARVKKDPTPKGIDMSVLPEELKEYVSKLG